MRKIDNTGIIGGREAVPLRLLPFANGRITSKRWLEIFRHADEEMTLTAHHLRDGYVLEEIAISYWVNLDDLTQFPSRAFVWRDELESAFSAHFRSDNSDGNELDGSGRVAMRTEGKSSVTVRDNDLLLDAPLSDHDRQWVFEGFDTIQVGTSGMPTEREIWAISYNNANPIRWDALATLDLIKLRDAILYMHGLNPGEHPQMKFGLTNKDVSKVIPKRVADARESGDFFIAVMDALNIASSGHMIEATALDWVEWAAKKSIQVHSQFRAIAERQKTEKHLTDGITAVALQPSPADALPVDAKENNQPLMRQRHQEQEILRVIKKLGYEAKALSKPLRGKKGIKSEVRAELKFSAKVFDKAWERLRNQEEIQDCS